MHDSKKIPGSDFQGRHYQAIPDMYSILTLDNLFKSAREAETLSRPPNKLSIPSVRHMRKNNTDHTGAAGMLRIASENAINTKPGPRAAWQKRKVVLELVYSKNAL